MAGKALHLGIGKQLSGVTLLATDFAVRAGQREFCFAMIERKPFPIVRPMTGLALIAQFALVNIIAFVTTNTGVW